MKKIIIQNFFLAILFFGCANNPARDTLPLTTTSTTSNTDDTSGAYKPSSTTSTASTSSDKPDDVIISTTSTTASTSGTDTETAEEEKITDLFAEKVEYTESAGNYKFKCLVKNNGTEDIGSFKITWLINDVSKGVKQISSLNIDSEVEAELDTSLASGDNKVICSADGDKAIEENNEENNNAETLITATVDDTYVDLKPIQVSILRQKGAQYTFQSGIKNVGNKISETCVARWLIDSKDTDPSSSFWLDPISSGESLENDKTSLIALLKPGSHKISFKVDDTNRIKEKDETNNVSEKTIDVPKILDLAPLTIATELLEVNSTDQTAKIKFTSGIINFGNTDSGDFTVNWLYKGSIINTNKTHKSVGPFSKVTDGNSTLSAWIGFGTNEVIFKINPEGRNETNLTNNEVKIQFSLNPR